MSQQMLRIALLQLNTPGANLDAALTTGESACRQARELGADVALFPEMWSNGYRFFDLTLPDANAAREAWAAQAVARDGSFVKHFRELARALDMAIAVTYLEQWPGGPRNTATLFDRSGAHVLTYAKVHTCDFDVERFLTPGDAFPVATLDAACGPVQVGMMICYDREFPESARLLMLGGAEVILTPNACEMEVNRLSQLRARAMENMAAIALANYAGGDCGGRSVAYDGMAFDPGGRSREMCVVEGGPAEGVLLAEFDLDALRAYRNAETWGNAYRRPHHYGPLTDTVVAPPFVRADLDGAPYDPTTR